MAGVLVMCTRSKESRAVKEALDILQRVSDLCSSCLEKLLKDYTIVW